MYGVTGVLYRKRTGCGAARDSEGTDGEDIPHETTQPGRAPRPRGLLWNGDNGQPTPRAACLPSALPGA